MQGCIQPFFWCNLGLSLNIGVCRLSVEVAREFLYKPCKRCTCITLLCCCSLPAPIYFTILYSIFTCNPATIESIQRYIDKITVAGKIKNNLQQTCNKPATRERFRGDQGREVPLHYGTAALHLVNAHFFARRNSKP